MEQQSDNLRGIILPTSRNGNIICLYYVGRETVNIS